jgi:hypothetical protein
MKLGNHCTTLGIPRDFFSQYCMVENLVNLALGFRVPKELLMGQSMANQFGSLK